ISLVNCGSSPTARGYRRPCSASTSAIQPDTILNARYCSSRANSRSRASNSARSSGSSTSPDGSSRAALRSSRVAATTTNELVCSRSQASPAALMCAMNSSVTLDNATSVMSSLCLEMSCSSRSNGPSKLSSRTLNPAFAASSESDPVPSSSSPAVLIGLPARTAAAAARPHPGRSLGQPPHQLGVLAVQFQVGQRRRDRLADDPATVHRHAVLGSQREPGLLQRQQLLRADVHGDLLVVPDPAGAADRAGPGGPAPAGPTPGPTPGGAAFGRPVRGHSLLGRPAAGRPAGSSAGRGPLLRFGPVPGLDPLPRLDRLIRRLLPAGRPGRLRGPGGPEQL